MHIYLYFRVVLILHDEGIKSLQSKLDWPTFHVDYIHYTCVAACVFIKRFKWHGYLRLFKSPPRYFCVRWYWERNVNETDYIFKS